MSQSHGLQPAVWMYRQGKANFGDAGVFVEKYVQRARHIEVQMFGDGEGNMVTFVERECSIQRRHQKIVEETPSPYVGKLISLTNHPLAHPPTRPPTYPRTHSLTHSANTLVYSWGHQ